MELQASVFGSGSEISALDNVIPLCELAKALEEAGEFESAAETLRSFWNGVPHYPKTTGLTDQAKAELLLRTGTLTGWLGGAKQIADAQETAKDLISESAALFEAIGMSEKVAEARVDLAICYWRESALDEARVTLQLVLDSLGETESDQKLRALYNSAIVEKVATRDQEALRIYREIAPKFESCKNHSLRAKFHNFSATLLRGLAASGNREEYIDKALIEYAAASFHFEQAGHDRFRAHVENNTAYLFADIGRFPEARAHVISAKRLFSKVGDRGGTAYADDTLAQIYLLEGKSDEAEKVARRAVHALGRGGEQSYLAEALTTHGKALARLSQIDAARSTLDQALEIAQIAGNPDRGGIAAVTAIEELSDYLSIDTLQNYYSTAEALLANSQNLSIKTRLGECARRVLTASLANTSATSTSSPAEQASIPANFSLDAEVLRYEGTLIRKALQESGGSITRAARLLGVTHQGLAFILNGRHSDLLSVRTPVKKRRRSIIRHH